MPNQSKAKSRNDSNVETENVPLQRRTVLDGHCSFLAPANITNSGRADGGFMDRIGIADCGLGLMFNPLNPNVLGPVEAFYSNDAYARPGFATMHLELHPPLETIGDDTTQDGLMEYLMGFLRASENDHFRRGDYERITSVPAPLVDENDENAPGDLPGHVVQYGFEVPITPGPGIPPALTATTYAAIVHFPERGNVLFKANNFERHTPPLDYRLMLGSLRYITDAPYLGPDPILSGFRALLSSSGDLMQANVQRARAQCLAWTRATSTTRVKKPSSCLTCGADKSRGSNDKLYRCSKCHVATYCSTDCQRSDWKRHKRTDCVGAATTR